MTRRVYLQTLCKGLCCDRTLGGPSAHSNARRRPDVAAGSLLQVVPHGCPRGNPVPRRRSCAASYSTRGRAGVDIEHLSSPNTNRGNTTHLDRSRGWSRRHGAGFDPSPRRLERSGRFLGELGPCGHLLFVGLGASAGEGFRPCLLGSYRAYKVVSTPKLGNWPPSHPEKIFISHFRKETTCAHATSLLTTRTQMHSTRKCGARRSHSLGN